MKVTNKIYLYIVMALMAITIDSKAQLNPLSAQYYNNQYLINPAYAGVGGGLKVNAAYRKLWDNVPGAPLVQSITGDYGFNRVGVGLNVYNERAGLQRQVRVVGSYAYHLPLSGNGDQLHFGVSFGFMNQRLDDGDINGNPADPLVASYNTRKTYVDGDFGLAYTSGHLEVQASVPNLKSVLKKDAIMLADATTFYSAVAYRIDLVKGSESSDIVPKVAYRRVKGFDDIYDAGAQLNFANKEVYLLGLYHTSKSATFGVGMDYQKKYLIGASYSTQTSALNNYTNGSFEINLRLNLK